MWRALPFTTPSARKSETWITWSSKTTGKVLGVIVNVSGFIGLGHSHREFSWNALHYDPDLKGFRADLLQSKVT